MSESYCFYLPFAFKLLTVFVCLDVNPEGQIIKLITLAEILCLNGMLSVG